MVNMIGCACIGLETRGVGMLWLTWYNIYRMFVERSVGQSPLLDMGWSRVGCNAACVHVCFDLKMFIFCFRHVCCIQILFQQSQNPANHPISNYSQVWKRLIQILWNRWNVCRIPAISRSRWHDNKTSYNFSSNVCVLGALNHKQMSMANCLRAGCCYRGCSCVHDRSCLFWWHLRIHVLGSRLAKTSLFEPL